MNTFRVKKYGVVDGKSHLLIEMDENVTELINRLSKGNSQHGVAKFDDNRFITSRQRRKIWATIGDVADYMGDIPIVVAEYFKIYTMIDHGIDYFSLSDCSMTTANLMIETIIDRVIDWDIPLSTEYIGERVGNVEKYIYKCLETRTCAITGVKRADIHHVDRVGMGRNRKTIDHSNLRLMPLSRDLHRKVHTMGRQEELEYYDKYKLKPIRLSSKHLIKLKIQKVD